MTGAQLVSTLGFRLEDEAASIYSSSVKLDALNMAQKTVVSMIDNSYLTELETVKNDQALSSGAVSFSSASIDPIRNGIIGIYDETNDKWCTFINPRDVHTLDSQYYSGTTSSPIAYIFSETIYVKPTTVSTVDIWYLKSPTDLADDSTECELNPALQEAVLDFAEAQLFRADGKIDRADMAYKTAAGSISALNQRVNVDALNKVGSKGI